MSGFDFDNPAAQTADEGRAYEARITFTVPVDASEAEIADYIAFELGGGTMACGQPLESCGINRVDVSDVRSRGYRVLVDWSARSEEGTRTGRSRVVRDNVARASGAPLTARGGA